MHKFISNLSSGFFSFYDAIFFTTFLKLWGLYIAAGLMLRINYTLIDWLDKFWKEVVSLHFIYMYKIPKRCLQLCGINVTRTVWLVGLDMIDDPDTRFVFFFLLFYLWLNFPAWFLRPTGGKPNHAGFLPGWGDVCRNSRSAFPLSDGRQRDGVHHSHHKAHQWHQLDEIPHGPTTIPDFLNLRDIQQATTHSRPPEKNLPMLRDRHSVNVFSLTCSQDLSSINLTR